MKRLAAVVLALLAFTACGSSGTPKPAASATPTITPTSASPSASPLPTVKPAPATLTLAPILQIKIGSTEFPNFTTSGKHCNGTGGYGDLKAHRAVTIYNQKGNKIVGTGFLHAGIVIQGSCYIGAPVRDVPKLPFYEVQFANRNKVPFSQHDLVHGTALETIG